jgi:hypothetical protein
MYNIHWRDSQIRQFFEFMFTSFNVATRAASELSYIML